MDWKTPKTPGYLLITGFYMSKFLEEAATRIPSHSFPIVKILVSQNFLFIFNNFQKNADISNLKRISFHYFHEMQNFIRFQEFYFLNLAVT